MSHYVARVKGVLYSQTLVKIEGVDWAALGIG